MEAASSLRSIVLIVTDLKRAAGLPRFMLHLRIYRLVFASTVFNRCMDQIHAAYSAMKAISLLQHLAFRYLASHLFVMGSCTLQNGLLLLQLFHALLPSYLEWVLDVTEVKILYSSLFVCSRGTQFVSLEGRQDRKLFRQQPL